MTHKEVDQSKRILVVGAGPTGLGAATRLHDVGHTNWLLVDPQPAGGLASSFVDDKGFTWDIGGHVIFSHYTYYDQLMQYAVQDWNEHQRESWVFVADTWVPYPFQNNIHRLPNEQKEMCLNGLLDVYKEKWDSPPQNFDEYFTRQMGDGIAEIFMRPYNFKVWAVPPRTMSTEWMGERVATVDVKKVCKHVIHNTDELGWGPNKTFIFPKKGGTGAIWSALGEKLPQGNCKFGKDGYRLVSVDVANKTAKFADGTTEKYDTLISTIPIDDLLGMVSNVPGVGDDVVKKVWQGEVAPNLQYSATNVIGIGIKGTPPAHLKTMCWMYFPESNSPFYRVTVFSNYAAANAPEGCWSLMLEVSESAKYKPVDTATIVQECIQGCYNSQLLTKERDEIVDTWYRRFHKGYPTPFIGRNELLERVQPTLLANDILSRGRFGAWKYEVANQDHSCMQGVEAVEHVLFGSEEVTHNKPNYVNTRANTEVNVVSLKVPERKTE